MAAKATVGGVALGVLTVGLGVTFGGLLARYGWLKFQVWALARAQRKLQETGGKKQQQTAAGTTVIPATTTLPN